MLLPIPTLPSIITPFLKILLHGHLYSPAISPFQGLQGWLPDQKFSSCHPGVPGLLWHPLARSRALSEEVSPQCLLSTRWAWFTRPELPRQLQHPGAILPTRRRASVTLGARSEVLGLPESELQPSCRAATTFPSVLVSRDPSVIPTAVQN